VDRGVGSGEVLQTGHESFSFSKASRCVVAAVVVVDAVGGWGEWRERQQIYGGEEDGADVSERMERSEMTDLG
jgi:hypothetical protein